MAKWMDELTTVEKDSIEKIPYHKDYYIYCDKFKNFHLFHGEKELCNGREIEVFANGDYAVTKDYDSWTLYRDETPLCSGVWVNARMDGSYKYKFFNQSFNKYVIRTVMPNGEFEDEVEGHETHQEEQFDYNVM